ncbi:MAG: TonB-dependent receptor, partial [Thermodesulfobacteriota bacterium]
IEAELERTFRDGSRVYANYTFQEPEDRETHRRLPNVAKHKANVGADLAITEYLNANLNVFWSDERPRVTGDPRDALAKYTLVDLTLIAKDFAGGLELRLSGHNILDEDYEDPEDMSVPGDLPRDGVSVIGEVLYRF